MKICFVNSFYFPDRVGGAEESVKILAESLVLSGHHVAVITTGDRDSIDIVSGVRVYRVAIRNLYGLRYHGKTQKYFNFLWHGFDTYNYPTALKVSSIMINERPDIVHTNNLKGFSVAVWSIAKQLGIPIVHTLRDYYLLCPKATMFNRDNNCLKQCMPCFVYSYFRRLSSANVNYVVGISDFILQRHLKNNFFPNSVRNVVFNAYDKKTDLGPIHTKGKKLVLGYIGHLDRFKGVEFLLKEFSTLNSLPITLILAGTGENEYVKGLIYKYSSDSVCFEGYLAPEIFFRRIDVLIVPSLWNEPLGRVIFEAYSYGIPVIASRRGGMPEIIDHNKTGFVFDPSRPETLAIAIKKLLNTSFRASMQEAINRKFEEFRPERIVSKYQSIYKGLIS